MIITKNKLLSLNIFYDNEYLDKYVQLINNNELTTKIKNCTEYHHIVPKVYFNIF